MFRNHMKLHSHRYKIHFFCNRLPDPRRDHAVAMCRFARDILYSFSTLTKSMEVTLGPDTGELGLRIGLHSGPVTAGVLRGERARFQVCTES